jgi:hypothetical protein
MSLGGHVLNVLEGTAGSLICGYLLAPDVVKARALEMLHTARKRISALPLMLPRRRNAVITRQPAFTLLNSSPPGLPPHFANNPQWQAWQHFRDSHNRAAILSMYR